MASATWLTNPSLLMMFFPMVPDGETVCILMSAVYEQRRECVYNVIVVAISGSLVYLSASVLKWEPGLELDFNSGR